jgi:hypothetical protein
LQHHGRWVASPPAPFRRDWCGPWASTAAHLPDFADKAAIFTVAHNRLSDFQCIMHLADEPNPFCVTLRK